MIRAIKSFFHSIVDLFGRIESQEPIAASQTLFLARLSTCGACPQFDRYMDTCKICYCVIHIKARLQGEECPLKKW